MKKSNFVKKNKLWNFAIMLVASTTIVACNNGAKTESAYSSDNEPVEVVDYTDGLKDLLTLKSGEYTLNGEELKKSFSPEFRGRVEAEHFLIDESCLEDRLDNPYRAVFTLSSKGDTEYISITKEDEDWYKIACKSSRLIGQQTYDDDFTIFAKLIPSLDNAGEFLIDDVVYNEKAVDDNKQIKDFTDAINNYYKEIVYSPEIEHDPVYSVMTKEVTDSLVDIYSDYIWDGIDKYDVIDLAFGLCVDSDCPFSPYKLTDIDIMPLGKDWYKVVASYKGEHYDDPSAIINGSSLVYMRLKDSDRSKYGFEIYQLSVPNEKEIKEYKLLQTAEEVDDNDSRSNADRSQSQSQPSTPEGNVAGKKFYSLQGSATEGYYYFFLTFNNNGAVIKSYAEKGFGGQGPEEVDDIGTYTVSGNRIDVNFHTYGNEVYFYKGRISDGVRSFEAIEGEGTTWRH